MNRIETLLQTLKWSQREMADYLGLSQPSVARMVKDGTETGPVAKLLDRLDAELEPTPSIKPFPTNP